MVIGSSFIRLGQIVKPFIGNNDELGTLIESAQENSESMTWCPVPDLIRLFEIAEENNLLERAGESVAIGFFQVLSSQRRARTPEDVLLTMTQGFHEHHKGNVGRQDLRVIGKNTVEIIDTTYVPCGYLIPMLRKAIAGFGAKKVKVVHPPGECKKNGASACKITFSWEEGDLLKMRKEEITKS